MKKITLAIIIVLLMSYISVDATELKYSKEIGTVKLNVPIQKEIRKYLGLKQDSGQFTIAQMRQGILIIEIFNMYCPHCQHYAPVVNELYSRINSRPDTKNNVYMIGIGVGNSPFEVDVFRKKYKVSFPLFDDKGYSVAGKLDGVLTPHLFGVVIDGRGSYKVFYSLNGGFDNADEFLNNILKLSAEKH